MEKLYIQQKIFKITDHYPITNQHKEIVYQVDEKFRWFLKKFYVSDKHGDEVFVIEQRLSFFLRHFDVRFKNGETLTIDERLSVFRHKLQIDASYGTIDIRGNLLSSEYSVLLNGQVIGVIHRKLLSLRDVFEIQVHDATHRDLLVAIVIAIDVAQDQSESQSANTN